MRQRARFAKGEIDQAALTVAEDKAIVEAIRLQERLGFKFVTDGEFRRRSYHSFFYGALCKLRIDTIGGADAVGASGAGGHRARPEARHGSGARRRHSGNGPAARVFQSHSDKRAETTSPEPRALRLLGR